MNLPEQPDSNARTPLVDVVHPQQADTDPFFSLALNVPSGPVGTLGIIAPSEDANQTEDNKHSGEDVRASELELIEEIDIHLFQLENPSLKDAELEIPMPIRNAMCVDTPESSQAVENATEAPASAAPRTLNTPEVVVQDASGRFIARNNCVIQIDGNEGFDYIDLSDRDIAHVTFNQSSITVVDATTNESFTIEHQNISHALFSNGHMVELH